MAHRWLKLLIVLSLVVSFTGQAFAQNSQPAQSEERARASGGPRRQLATIIFAGLGGAILGLSTLSFYGRPQDKLSNIAIGFAVGVIAGTSYVTYKAATRPEEFYGDRPWIENEAGHWASIGPTNPKSPSSPKLGMTFEF